MRVSHAAIWTLSPMCKFKYIAHLSSAILTLENVCVCVCVCVQLLTLNKYYTYPHYTLMNILTEYNTTEVTYNLISK